MTYKKLIIVYIKSLLITVFVQIIKLSINVKGMDSDSEDKPPAPPARLTSTMHNKGDMQSHKPLPSVPETEKKKKKIFKQIFIGEDKCNLNNINFIEMACDKRLVHLYIYFCCF